MTERVRRLLAAVEDRLQALDRVTRKTNAAGWVRQCEAEGWSVALVAYHIARGFDRQASFLEAAATRREAHHYTWDETHALNARSPPSTRSRPAKRSWRLREQRSLGCDRRSRLWQTAS